MAGSPKWHTAAERVAAQLTTWPSLSTVRPACGAGRAFGLRDDQILHLHTGDEADLRLTRACVDRIDRVLTESGQVSTRPGDDWVTVRLDTDTGAALLLSLMSLAIRASDGPVCAQPCTWDRNGTRRRLLSRG